MATYTSTTNGDWNNAATWGGGGWPNAAGDVVNIGHLVKYNVNDDTNAMGVITINANGKLYWDANAASVRTLRLGANMSVNGGELELRAGAFIRILNGFNITVQTTTNSRLDWLGTSMDAEEPITTQTEIGDGYLKVADASKFASLDWIAVFDDTDHHYLTNKQDEGFIVHSVDTTTTPERIYIRRRVARTFTLNSQTSTGSNAWYATEDVRGWYPNLKFVIGNEVFTVSSIDKYNYIIYTNENAGTDYVTSTISYETGVEKVHATDNVVRKLCTTVVGATAGNNYVDVASSSGWVSGGVIALEGNSYTAAYNEEVTIATISVGGGAGGSDRLNLTGNLTKDHSAGKWAMRMDRDVVIHGGSSDTVATNNGYVASASSGNARYFQLKNVEFKYYGNNTSVYTAGFMMRTTNIPASPDNHYIENCSFHHTYMGSVNNGAVGGYSSCYAMEVRNNVFNNTYCNVYTNPHIYGCVFNNLVIGHTSCAYMVVNPYYGWEGGYNATSGSDYGLYLNYMWSLIGDRRLYSCKFTYFNHRNTRSYRTIYRYGTEPMSLVEKIDIESDGTYGPFFLEAYSGMGTVYSNIKTNVFSTAKANSQSYTSSTSNPFSQISLIQNVNFIPQNKVMIYYYGYCQTDETLYAGSKNYSWKFYPQRNSVDSPIGFFVTMIGIPGRTVKVGAWVRKNSTLNSTRPYIVIRDQYTDADLATIVYMDNVNDTWQFINNSYTFVDQNWVTIRVGTYGSAGNFWICDPILDNDGCMFQTGVQQPEWRLGTPTANGVRLSGARIM